MREHVVAASKAMKMGDWRTCHRFVVNEKMNGKVWDLFPEADKVRAMLVRWVGRGAGRGTGATPHRSLDATHPPFSVLLRASVPQEDPRGVAAHVSLHLQQRLRLHQVTGGAGAGPGRGLQGAWPR